MLIEQASTQALQENVDLILLPQIRAILQLAKEHYSIIISGKLVKKKLIIK